MACALIAQSGGPTAVMNATFVAAVRQAREARHTFSRFLGSVHGLKGVLEDRFIDLFSQDEALLDRLADAPGAALGSSRVKLSAEEIGRLLESFRRHDVRCFFYNGGNGSVGTALDIERGARGIGYEMQVIGIPKTVDNDIVETDHTPGYGSAARFWAHATRDMGLDHRALPSPILICEVMGRNVGWVVAATAFARHYEDDAPHLIYCPERPLPRAKLLADIDAVYRRFGRAFVCIGEGQLDENGEAFGADVDRPDSPQHRLASNLAHAVAKFVSKELKLRVRSERPSLLGRCSSAYVSEADRRSAELCGQEGVRAALSGETGKMIALRREPGSCISHTTLVPLRDVARKERPLPPEFLSASGNDLTDAFLAYAQPLVGEVAPLPRLRE
jgi:ATP-dependent phosphofructokinase / diphosphate-dependent phosphofructokinase